MPAPDAGFKIVARTAGRHLAAVAGVRCDRLEPVASEVQTAERFADRAFRASRGRERFIVYFEAYTTWRAEAPWSVLAKSGLLSERERLPTVSLVFILRPLRYRPQQGRFRLAVGRGLTQLVRFHEVCLWRQTPRTWWEEVPGLMPLYPLTHHGRPGREAVMHAAEAIKTTEADVVVRADLLATLGIFGKLAYPKLDVAALIGREQMKESKFYQEILAEGRQEGFQEGRQEGRLEGQRASVLEVIEARFGPAAVTEIAPLVNSLTDPDRLARLLRLASRCGRLEEFRDHFREGVNGR